MGGLSGGLSRSGLPEPVGAAARSRARVSIRPLAQGQMRHMAHTTASFRVCSRRGRVGAGKRNPGLRGAALKCVPGPFGWCPGNCRDRVGAGHVAGMIDTFGGDCYYSQPEVNAPKSAAATALRGRTLFQHSNRDGATLAQLVEHPTCNRKVGSSILLGGSKRKGLPQARAC